MSEDVWETSEMREWAQSALDDLVPKMQDSSVIVSLVPRGPSDIKFAVETGLALMLDKPIILMVAPGTQVPAKLAQVADAIIEYGDLSDPATSHRLTFEVNAVIERRERARKANRSHDSRCTLDIAHDGECNWRAWRG